MYIIENVLTYDNDLPERPKRIGIRPNLDPPKSDTKFKYKYMLSTEIYENNENIHIETATKNHQRLHTILQGVPLPCQITNKPVLTLNSLS